MNELINKGKKAKEVSFILSNLSTLEKNKGLNAMANSLVNNKEEILKANKIDLQASMEKGTSKSMLDRLALTEERIEGMSNGLRQVVALPDPIGEVLGMWTRPNGLQIGQKRVPLGVIGIIYEARPNVTSDAAALCLKSGNTVILRGGKEAINSNRIIAKTMREAVKKSGLSEDVIQLVEDTSRESANALMQMNEYVDVLIPRGGAGLIKAVVNQATIPVIETGTGNCHIFVDETADFDMAMDIILNAKTQRIGVCNACESLVIHEKIADTFLPELMKRLAEKNVEVHGDEKVMQIAGEGCMKRELLVPATEEDWGREYLDYKLSAKTVSSIDEAIAHINQYNTGHSEAIITNNYSNAEKFLNEIDAACVYVNASTRFTDGFEFGFGAEIGISTQKLHARGPMGLIALTSTKYIIYGNGQIRK